MESAYKNSMFDEPNEEFCGKISLFVHCRYLRLKLLKYKDNNNIICDTLYWGKTQLVFLQYKFTCAMLLQCIVFSVCTYQSFQYLCPLLVFPCYLLVLPWAEIPGRGQGDASPPRFWRWGTQYQMSPPPPPTRFFGRTIFRRKNRIFSKICLTFFLFFLLVRMSESDRRVPLICR